VAEAGARILTCTWAPTVLAPPNLSRGPRVDFGLGELAGPELTERMLAPVQRADALGVDYLLVAQRWWGTGEEIEGSSYDCLALTAFYAARTERIRLVTAIHPGFFLPAPIAKWGASLDRLTRGRWSINVTSGWHEAEFAMYGAELVPHDERYARSAEFIEVLRGAWSSPRFDYDGRFYRVRDLRLEPRPFSSELEVFQGGQSEAARDLAARHSDWMFLNGGPPAKIAAIVRDVRKRAAARGRRVRFALYAIPVCRESDAEAEDAVAALLAAADPDVRARRRERTRGAQGMWASPGADPLAELDSNEGFASRLIGAPDTILARMREFAALGIDCFHVALVDERFNREVLPRLNEPR
jgi:FMNH2-dependent dimethyl sulfone monooxygenase